MRSSSRVLVSLLVLGLALVPLPAGAQAAGNPCDDLADLADAWDTMAATLDEQGGADEEMAATLAALADGTREVARVLTESGAGAQVELAAKVAAAVTTAERATSLQDRLDGMDTIVDRLDDLVDQCDRDMAADDPGSAAPGMAPGAAPGAAAGPAGGAIHVRYAPSANPAYQPLAALAADSGVFEGIAGLVDSTLVLPADLDTVFTDCGEPNAFFDAEQGRVVMCYEFLDLFARVFADTAQSPEELGDAVLDVAAFFYLHEIGHALVSYLDLPVTGREEDSVDGLATLVLLQAGVDGAVLSAIENFAAMADRMQDPQELPFWDEHSLDAQRLYDVACLVYGSDPAAYSDMVGPDLLPEERAVRCPEEYRQKDRAWDALLAPYFAPGS